MREQMSVKQHSHTMLIKLDALVDLQVGYILWKFDKAIEARGGDPDIERLQAARNRDPDFLTYVDEDDLGYDVYFESFKEDLKENYEGIFKKAPVVHSINKIAEVFSSPKNAEVGSCEILTLNPLETRLVKERFPDFIVSEMPATHKINFARYARIVLSDIDDVFLFPQIRYKHIAILDYPRNFEVIGNEVTFKKAPVLAFRVSNEFEVIRPI